jgi:hypothetical protein
MGALSAEVAGSRWKDWLFVFGTAMVEDRMPGDPRKEPGEITMFNVALVCKGGRSLVVQKKFRSPVDWMDLPDVCPKSDAVKGFTSLWPHYFDRAVPMPYAEELNDRTLRARVSIAAGFSRRTASPSVSKSASIIPCNACARP